MLRNSDGSSWDCNSRGLRGTEVQLYFALQITIFVRTTNGYRRKDVQWQLKTLNVTGRWSTGAAFPEIPNVTRSCVPARGSWWKHCEVCQHRHDHTQRKWYSFSLSYNVHKIAITTLIQKVVFVFIIRQCT